MRRCIELVRKFGKKALFIASAFAVTKSTVAVLDAQWYVGSCVGFSTCYVDEQCTGNGNPMYECRCRGYICTTLQVC